MKRLAIFAALIATACGGPATSAEPSDVQVTQAFENNQFGNLREMVDFTTAVVSGEVTDVLLNREDHIEPEGMSATVLTVVLRVDRSLKGDTASDEVRFEFQGPEVEPGVSLSEYPASRINGILTPAVGERLVVFLYEIDADESPGKAPASHGLVNFDGIFRVGEGDRIETTVDGDSRIAHKLAGKSLDELSALLNDPEAAGEVLPGG